MPRKLILATLLLGAFWAGSSTGAFLGTELALIRGYQAVGSPVISKVVRCRFRPTCSVFASQVLKKEGLFRGNVAIAGRLLHCSPIGMAADWMSGKEVFQKQADQGTPVVAESSGGEDDVSPGH